MKLRFSSAHLACVVGLAHALVLGPVACGDSASSDGSSSTGQACKEELAGCSLNEECCSGGCIYGKCGPSGCIARGGSCNGTIPCCDGLCMTDRCGGPCGDLPYEGQPCTADGKCCPNRTCIDGVCEFPRAVGEPCSKPADCATGLCTGGLCADGGAGGSGGGGGSSGGAGGSGG